MTAREPMENILKEEGFEHFGFARLGKPVSFEIYKSWLEKNYQGEMSYLDRHAPHKAQPREHFPRAQTAIVVTQNYLPHPYLHHKIPNLRLASYARGEDYHHWFKGKLEVICERLRRLYPQEEFLTFTDSGPVLERDLAYQAGLGWIGKNTCLISKNRGSLFFIGEIFTSLELPHAELTQVDHCGTCTRCIDACPTGALTAPRELDARKCISYLNIEAKSVPPEHLRTQMGDWFFGCDICQTVCPWNVKFKKADFPKPSNDRAGLLEDLKYILTSSNKALERHFKSTALSRAGGKGLKRNALIVCANLKIHELKTEIEALRTHENLGELANWTLLQLST